MTDSPHAVVPSDEARHTPDPDDLWNESYYCDFVQADGSLGGWLRLGLYPNRDVAWWTAWIVGPGRPGIASVDYSAPVPPGDTLNTTSDAGARIDIDVARPLEEFRVSVSPHAALSFAQPADVYGDRPGPSAELGLDLTWTTDGSPYHYVATTRYEIPCLVTGTVTIDGDTYHVDGQGQRDHSWAVRDWWAVEWCWNSMRLDDGTRIHLSDIRIPNLPVFFGYVQQPADDVRPVTSVSVTEELGDHGLPTRVRIDVATDPAQILGLEVVPAAFGPVLLVDDKDATRVSRFPRAMVTCRADDGRTGAGWIEFNQVQREPATP
jgi:hypothetical protein